MGPILANLGLGSPADPVQRARPVAAAAAGACGAAPAVGAVMVLDAALATEQLALALCGCGVVRRAAPRVRVRGAERDERADDAEVAEQHLLRSRRPARQSILAEQPQSTTRHPGRRSVRHLAEPALEPHSAGRAQRSDSGGAPAAAPAALRQCPSYRAVEVARAADRAVAPRVDLRLVDRVRPEHRARRALRHRCLLGLLDALRERARVRLGHAPRAVELRRANRTELAQPGTRRRPPARTKHTDTHRPFRGERDDPHQPTRAGARNRGLCDDEWEA